MPELPEVETTRRGIEPHIQGQIISKIDIRNGSLRWPVPAGLTETLPGQMVKQIDRRAKYLLLRCDSGTLIIHLGMSGRLHVLDNDNDIGKHDHVDICFSNGKVLRYTDPRRFGAVLWSEADTDLHPLIAHLGPEPLSAEFNADYLLNRAKGRSANIKSFIMNGEIVVGVGNIYANEALFMAGVHPARAAGKVTAKQVEKLVAAIKQVLEKALEAGGTTLRDFRKSDGMPGYFAQQLNVYGRQNQPCLTCHNPISCIRQAQRATYFCQHCQPE
ncbi:bifunctional DNA-formamidopyrimidine glycosylase/DNA-(apurinic or apyrimidinic site) lyase [Methylophaga sp. OBS4]|uniref:bifunctional DNA-formamidopyrimidine glycosylase/DNA-(apurinic or apyrimidinic site) lyase n=1 Tax=Methylophaga sp. OBS4 TaxID=2991935 RepID=UPI00225B9C01|nr:bifunctional DNA-formamidopyrimidine glycosylase/DNA-(apurinic or apyrimidinic site) lyase [Methylophaga sp. OBS4]MCX4188519.1 bifunctional DNA-formamidopyrimidine glycosylase/DNA-(apurinic or apyrimidinic site) lyase [Methylophaga sp. OBS4]